MALPFDVANFNLVNFAEAYSDIFDSDPKEVAIQLKDADGNIATKTVANRGRFKQQLWDDVGAAIGQMSRTFYVDAENGSDLNDGSSTAPFATIAKACESVPVGSQLEIRVSNASDYVFDEYVLLKNKNVKIRDWDVLGDGSYVNLLPGAYVYDETNKYAAIRRFALQDATLSLYRMNVKLPQVFDGYTLQMGSGIGCFVDMGGGNTSGMTALILNRANMQIPAKNDQDKAFYVAGGKYWDHSGLISISQYSSHHSVETTGTKLFYLYAQTCSFVSTSSEITDADGAVSYDYFDGIVYDADGKPRNIVSNQIF